MTWTNISDQSPSWSPDTDETPYWGGLNGELNPDSVVDDESAWDFQFTLIDGAWTFDSSSLLWSAKLSDVLMLKNLVLENGVNYTFNMLITNYSSTLDGFGNPALNPAMFVTLGYNTGYTKYLLDTTKTTQIITGTQISDDAGRVDDSISDGIDYQSVYFYGASSLVSGGTPTWRIQNFSIKRTDSVIADNWTDTSTSSSWTPLTDKTTVWS